jgi:hypothetical protein
VSGGAAALIAVIVALLGATAFAEPASATPPVILFSTPEGEGLAGRIEAELVSAGLAPRRVAIVATTPFEELVAIATAAKAAGAVRVNPDGAGAEMWIADAATGRVELRQSLSADGSPAMASVIAVRTAEFLRVSLLPAIPAPPAVAVRAPTVSATPAPAPARARVLLRLALAPAYLVSAGGVGAGVSTAGLIAVQGRHFGVEGLVAVPLAAGRLDTKEGLTRVSATMAGAGARARWAMGPSVEGDAAVGALAAHVRAVGTANAPFMSSTGALTGVALYARAGAAYDLTTWLALRADVLVGDLVPRAVIRSGASDAATWGRPFGAALLGLEAGLL